MTVGELADFLATQPRDREVILQKDAEGNGYSPGTQVSEGLYLAYGPYSGKVHPTPEWIAREAGPGSGMHGWYEDWSGDPRVERVVVLGPVN